MAEHSRSARLVTLLVLLGFGELKVQGALLQSRPAPTPGSLRLVGGRSAYEGRLEVYFQGAFGVVCDDRFTDAAARVACRQLGMSGGSALCCGAFGTGSGTMLLDEVTCVGNETRLEQCRHNGWGQTDCEPSEAVGVRCSGALGEPPPPTSSPGSLEPPPRVANQDGDVRLVDGWTELQGRLEVFYQGSFGSVCDDRFSYAAAQVVCRQLGMTGGTVAPCCGNYGNFGPAPGPILLDEVACIGNETRLDQCRHSPWGQSDCDQEEAVGVTCDGYVVSEGTAPEASPPPEGPASRNLSIVPPVKCIILPRNLTGGSDETNCTTEYFMDYIPQLSSAFTNATYRVVYTFADGAHSCPSPVRVSTNASTPGGPTILVRLGESTPSTLQRSIMIQRRGYTTTVMQSIGPDWLTSLWMDVSSSVDGQLEPYTADWKLIYDATEGVLRNAGPQIMGWRWKYGVSGITDGYIPAIHPDLVANSTGGGINATYQLVYHLAYDYYSFPGVNRFQVVHPRASTPLNMYVQLQSTSHPAGFVALLLQRVEGDSVWTVAQLAADSPEIASGQQGLFFTDVTSRSTWGCPDSSSAQLSPAPAAAASQPPPAADYPSLLETPTYPYNYSTPAFGAASALTCSLLLLGPGVTEDLSSDNRSSIVPAFLSARLDCWGSNGAFVPPLVEVGPLLAPHLSFSGIRVSSVAGNVSSGGQNAEYVNGQHWGITFIGTNLTLVDSLVADVPLSPFGPLIDCWNCSLVAFSNVTFRNLLPQRANNNRAGGAPEDAHGTMAASGVRAAALTDVTCSGVHGATGWACMLLEYAEPSTLPLDITMTRCTLEDNGVAPTSTSAAGTSSSAVLRRVLQRVNDTGAGAIVILGSSATNPYAVPLPATALTVRVLDSTLDSNAGGSGAVLFSNMPMDALVIINSSVSHNHASVRGGAIYLAGSVNNLVVRQGSVVDNNTIDSDLTSVIKGLGGAFYVSGTVRSFAIEGGSSVSGNVAISGGGALATGLSVGLISITDGSRADRNRVHGDPDTNWGSGGFILSDSALTRISNGTNFLVSGGSSVSGNFARYGGVIWVHWLKSFVVRDRSHVDGNKASFFAGVVQVEIALDKYLAKDRPVNLLLVTNSSSVSHNSASAFGVLRTLEDVENFTVSYGSRFDGNRADGSPAGLRCKQLHSITISHNSSLSFNEAPTSYESHGGIFSLFKGVGTFLLEDNSSMSHNLLGKGSGAILSSPSSMEAFIIRGSVAENNSASNGSGGLFNVDSLSFLEISRGARVASNRAGTGSGGIAAIALSIGSITIDGSILVNNSAYIDGGAISVGTDVMDSVLVVNGAAVEGNQAMTQNGGFLSVGASIQGSLRISNGSRLCSCSAGLSGGAIYVRESVYDDIAVYGTVTVCNNTATAGDGGAVHVGFRTDKLQLQAGSKVTNNSASGSGGFLYVAGVVANASIEASLLSGNKAGGDGGVVYTKALNSLLLASSAAYANMAGGDGGFVSASRITLIQLSSSEVAQNWAGGSGGVAAVLIPPDAVAISATNLTGNVAERGAGGVLSVVVPQPGSSLLNRVGTATGQILCSITDGSIVHGNGAYLDGGAIGISAEAANAPTGVQANEAYILLQVTIAGSTFSLNYAGGAGGALSILSPVAGVLDAVISVFNSSFTGNVAGSDVFRLGSSLRSGWGGAIAIASTPKFRPAAVMTAERESIALNQSQLQRQDILDLSVSQDSACSLSLEQSIFKENRCEGSGGAVAVVSCPTVIYNCMFSKNQARLSGGAVAGVVEAVFVSDISDEQQQGSNAEAVGGGLRRRMQQQEPTVIISSGAGAASGTLVTGDQQEWWLEIHGSSFGSNIAILDCGGGLYTEVAQGAGSRVSGSLFQNNSAVDFHGGGICVVSSRSGAEAHLSGGNRLINNTAGGQGGGIYASLGTGNVMTLDSMELSGNMAMDGGAVYVTVAAGSKALVTNVTFEDNTAYSNGGALYAQCSSSTGSTQQSVACGSNPILTLSSSKVTANSAVHGRGGAMFVDAGASVSLHDSTLEGNIAGTAGGGIAALGCELLTIDGGSIARGSAVRQGGGVFTHSCDRVLLQGVALRDNVAGSGGAAFFAGPSDDQITVEPVTGQITAIAPAVMVLGAKVSGNHANETQGLTSSSYQRYRGHGGGVFAYGNVTVLIADSDLSGNNSALVGAGLASSQSCADPEVARDVIDTLVVLANGAGDNRAEQQWAAIKAPAARPGGCWPSLLIEVQLPPKEMLPVWMQDPMGSPMQARCGSSVQQGPVVSGAFYNASSCANVSFELLHACALLQMLAPCTVSTVDDDAGAQVTSPSQAAHLAGALLDVAPTHMRPESFPGQLRPGTPASISVRLYNGLMQPVQRDTLDLTVTLTIVPADRPDGSSGGAAAPSGGRHLLSEPQHPWQDASVAYLDPGIAAGGSLTVPVSDGLATWPYLTVRGWPGRYTLVFTASSSEDSGLYEVSPLRLEVDLLHCQAGEELDLTWSQQPGAQPSWLSCSRCGRGRFTLWQDNRPLLWEINDTNYRTYMKDMAAAAVEGEASCLPCPSHATCLGGAVLLPEAGYWHSAPDSAQFHRCPKDNACGKGNGDGDWAAMPPLSPAQLQVGLDTLGAIVLMEVASITTIAGNTAEPAAVVTVLKESTAGVSDDTRSGWLALCQQLGYLAMAAAAGSNSSLMSINSARTSMDGAVISSLPELLSACTAWGAEAAAAGTGSGRGGGSDPYLQLECSQGYTGRLCAACMPGYFIDSEFECKTCPKMPVNITLAILSFLAGVALVLYTALTNMKENYSADGTGEKAGIANEEEVSPSDFLKVAIVHAQYYIIITRLPVAYPDVVTRLQAAVSSITGAESTIAFSYSCLRPGRGSGGQAEAQLLGALLVPVVIVLTSLVLWALRYLLLNRAKIRRQGNLRGSRLRGLGYSLDPGSRKAELEAEADAALGSTTDVEVGSTNGDLADHGDPGSSSHAFEIADMSGQEEHQPSEPSAQQGSPLGSGQNGRPAHSRPDRFMSHVQLSTPRARAAVARVRQTLQSKVGQTLQSKVGQVLVRMDNSLGFLQQLAIVHMVAIFILYPSWAQAALSVFACYHIDDGAGYFPDRQQATWRYGYWIRDMTQECYAGIHRKLYLPVGIVAVVLVCLGPPLTSFLMLMYHRKRLDRPSVQQRYGFLYLRYKPQFFWWESVLMMEELGMVAVEVFGRSLPVVSHQILLMLAAFILLSVINMGCAPVQSRTIVLLEFLSMGVLSLTITLSLYFVVSDNLGTHAEVIVGLLILAINVLLMAAFLFLVLRLKWVTVITRGATLMQGLRKRVRTGKRRVLGAEAESVPVAMPGSTGQPRDKPHGPAAVAAASIAGPNAKHKLALKVPKPLAATATEPPAENPTTGAMRWPEDGGTGTKVAPLDGEGVRAQEVAGQGAEEIGLQLMSTEPGPSRG